MYMPGRKSQYMIIECLGSIVIRHISKLLFIRHNILA